MKKDKKWFTLIELIIVIWLLAIMWVLSSNLDFGKMTNKQNSLMFSNSIYSNIETLRTNSLLGKWIFDGVEIIHPKKWSIQISTWSTNSTIQGFYSTGWALQKHKDFNVNFVNTTSKISLLTCYNISKTTAIAKTNVDLEIIWNALTLSWCTSPNNKILDITSDYKGITKIIRINTVSWVIEKTDI